MSLVGLGAATVAVAAGATAPTATAASVAQPHMDIALDMLKTALHQPQDAMPDKGGYRRCRSRHQVGQTPLR